MATFEMYAEHPDGWEYLGDCDGSGISLLSSLYQSKSDTRLLFVDAKLPRPLAVQQSKAAWMKGWLSFNLDNVERLEVKSMFKGIPDVCIIPKQEILDGHNSTV